MPKFITLDGIDGVGKSTQIERLAKHLRSFGHDVLCVRDPGTTEIGTRLRQLLLDPDVTMHRRTEAMLFMASRCEMVETVIRPALDAGRTVLSDRYLLANVVYQSVDSDVDPQLLWQIGRAANDFLEPDLTCLLDMPAEESMSRFDRPADGIESRGLEYLEKVRTAFLRQVAASGPKHVIIDAAQPEDNVTNSLIDSLTQVGL